MLASRAGAPRLVGPAGPLARRRRPLEGGPRSPRFSVCNGRFFGGGMQVAPDARMDDGLFDVVIWSGLGLVDFVTKKRMLYDGTHVTLPNTRVLRARTVEAEAASGARRAARRRRRAAGDAPRAVHDPPGCAAGPGRVRVLSMTRMIARPVALLLSAATPAAAAPAGTPAARPPSCARPTPGRTGPSSGSRPRTTWRASASALLPVRAAPRARATRSSAARRRRRTTPAATRRSPARYEVVVPAAGLAFAPYDGPERRLALTEPVQLPFADGTARLWPTEERALAVEVDAAGARRVLDAQRNGTLSLALVFALPDDATCGTGARGKKFTLAVEPVAWRWPAETRSSRAAARRSIGRSSPRRRGRAPASTSATRSRGRRRRRRRCSPASSELEACYARGAEARSRHRRRPRRRPRRAAPGHLGRLGRRRGARRLRREGARAARAGAGREGGGPDPVRARAARGAAARAESRPDERDASSASPDRASRISQVHAAPGEIDSKRRLTAAESSMRASASSRSVPPGPEVRVEQRDRAAAQEHR